MQVSQRDIAASGRENPNLSKKSKVSSIKYTLYNMHYLIR